MSDLWRSGAQRLDLAGFAVDTILVDAGDGAMTLRSFATLRDRMARDLPDHTVQVQECLAHPMGGGAARLMSQARHGVDGPFGQATHRPVQYRIALDGQGDAGLTDLWQVRDRGGMLLCMGVDPAQWARHHPGKPVIKPEPAADQITDDWARTQVDMLCTIMDGDLSAIHQSYDPAVELWLPSGEVQTGPHAADLFWLSLRAALPTGDFVIASATGQEDPLSAPRIAIRWYLTGTHDGWGRFGPPSGAKLCIMGMTHVEYGPRGVRREWTTIDDVAIWQQIYRKTG
ncbi:MAG: hypothetical protein ACPG7W_00570 [Paracoccaceae bacterium]